ncbi:MAK10-like protein [Tanacetum coccineum]
MGDENPIRTLGDYSKPSHEGYRNTIELSVGNNVVPFRSDTIRLVQNGCSFHRLRSEDPNQHIKDFLKLVDSLNLDGENRERTSLCLFQFSLRDQASNWLERIPAGSISTWKDLTTRFLAQFFPLGWTVKLRNDILIGPHDTQYCMEDPEQAFVEYASSRTDEAGVLSARSYPTEDPQCSTHIHSSINTITIHPKQPKESQVNKPDVEQEEGNLGNINSNPQPDPLASIATKQIIQDDDEPQNDGPNEGEGAATGELVVEYFDTFPTRDELTYHRENANGGISNFTRRIKGMHIFVGNFTYVVDFIIVEDISSIIDPRLSQVVQGRPFVEISNMTHDPPECVVRFIKGTDEVAYKMPHKIEQYDSLSNLEKEHTKSVYLRNDEDKRRGVEYVMNKILGFYKECLELGPEYLTGMDDDGKVT